MKKILKIAGIALAAIVGIVVVVAATCVIIVAANSPGKLEPLCDADGNEIAGAIAEKTFVEIGGVRQGMFIRSENPENPVILFLHGGPGSPELPMILPTETPERLEKYFTVCYWDQRGAGMSYNESFTAEDMTPERFVEDTREVTEYLRGRFGVDKVYLAGHSWGSYLGVKVIERYPELYVAYIGIGQVTWQQRSERLAYDYMLAHATEIGDEEAVRQLKMFDPAASDFPTNRYLMSTRTLLMNKYRIGILRGGVTMGDLAKDVLQFGGYTFGEKLNFLRGSMSSIEALFHNVIADNMFESSTAFDIPVYVVHGKWDYQVSYALAREWLDAVEAPAKGLFTFEDSAHSPNMDEPERFVRTVCGIAQEVAAGESAGAKKSEI